MGAAQRYIDRVAQQDLRGSAAKQSRRRPTRGGEGGGSAVAAATTVRACRRMCCSQPVAQMLLLDLHAAPGRQTRLTVGSRSRRRSVPVLALPRCCGALARAQLHRLGVKGANQWEPAVCCVLGGSLGPPSAVSASSRRTAVFRSLAQQPRWRGASCPSPARPCRLATPLPAPGRRQWGRGVRSQRPRRNRRACSGPPPPLPLRGTAASHPIWSWRRRVAAAAAPR